MAEDWAVVRAGLRNPEGLEDFAEARVVTRTVVVDDSTVHLGVVSRHKSLMHSAAFDVDRVLQVLDKRVHTYVCMSKFGGCKRQDSLS